MNDISNNADSPQKIGIGGNYIVKIIKKDGSTHLPFGDKPLKNLILDTFFNTMFFGTSGGQEGYPYSVHAFIQSCRVGDSNSAPVRTQIGLQGNLIETSHKSTGLYGVCDGTFISLSRDFTFSTNSTQSNITYREALVGCFGASGINSGVASPNITVSRFVFPSDVIVKPGETLTIYYTLQIGLDYLSRNVPISLSGDGIDFTGVIRMGSNNFGLNIDWGALPVSLNIGTILGHANSSYLHYRLVSDNTNTFTATIDSAYYSRYGYFSHIFGIYFFGNPVAGPDRVGFVDQSLLSSLVTYPTDPTNSNIIGPSLSSVKKSNYEANDSGASVILTHYLPPHSSSRTTSGIRLWATSQESAYSGADLYLKFTQSDYTTARTQIIPAGKPVVFMLKWQFVRI